MRDYGPVLYDRCRHCGLDIEYNGHWWTKGSCQSQCPARPSAKGGGYDDHVPMHAPATTHKIAPPTRDHAVKPRGRSAAAQAVFGGR